MIHIVATGLDTDTAPALCGRKEFLEVTNEVSDFEVILDEFTCQRCIQIREKRRERRRVRG